MVLHRFKPKPDKSIPFIIFISFLSSFLLSRFVTTYLPDFFIPIRGEHVHHFAYGIIFLSIIGFISIVYPLSYQGRLRLSVAYGLSLGLAYDEFAMWLYLDNIYKSRLTYDAIIIITLLMLNFIYFSDFWKKWGRHLGRLIKILFLNLPLKTIHYFWQVGQK